KMTMMAVAEGSVAEHIRTRLPASGALACALKTVPAHRLDRADGPLECGDFICGDSDAGRGRARALVSCLAGLPAVGGGPAARARSSEHLTALAVAINRRHHIHDARFRVIGL